jgi:hypothetical protein
VLRILLDALIAADIAFLRRYPETPGLYMSGVLYAEDDEGREEWKDIPATLARGAGDCKDLSAWRIAELRVRAGEEAHPRLTFERRGHRVKFHVTVRRQDGREEDPARALGIQG